MDPSTTPSQSSDLGHGAAPSAVAGPNGSPSRPPAPAAGGQAWPQPPGAYPPGAHRPASYPPGGYPPGAYGAYPPGAYAHGTYPPSAFPPVGSAFPPVYPGAYYPMAVRPRAPVAPRKPMSRKHALMLGGGIGVVVAGVATALAVGIAARPPALSVSSYDSQGSFQIHAYTEPHAKVRVKDVEVLADEYGSAELRLPFMAIRVGTEDVEVVAEVDGKTAREHLVLSRAAIPAELSITPAGGLVKDPIDIPCGGTFCSGNVTLAPDGTLTLGLNAAPGVRIALGAQTAVIDDAPLFTMSLALRGELMDLDLATLGGAAGADERVLVHRDVVVTSPDGAEKKGTFELSAGSVRRIAVAMLAQGAKGPLSLGAGDVAGKSRAALLLQQGRFLGKGKLRDVSTVITAKDLEERSGGSCGPYSDTGFGGGTFAPRKLVDEELVAFDRRTGREIGRLRVPAVAGQCPMTVWVSEYGSVGSITEGPSDAARDAFARTFVK